MYKKFKTLKGFSIVELLVGLSIGIIVLTGLMSFFFRTSKMISSEQNSVKTLSQLQFIMNRMIQNIKEANTELPGTGTTLTSSVWSQLPHLPYCRTFTQIITEPDNSKPRISPYYPVAYNFPFFQSGKTGTSDGWYPKTDTSNPETAREKPESNSLAFYKIDNLGRVTRVLYYTETDPKDYNSAKSLLLRKREQFNIESSSYANNFFDNRINTNDSIILSGVKSVQFTYPNLSKRLETDSPFLDNDLKNAINAITDGNISEKAYEQSKLMNPYRNTIGIKIITAGPQIGNHRATALELSTEVNIRN